MARRRPDRIRVESDGVMFDRFESLEVVNDITGVSEAVFQVGDDGAYEELEELVEPGQLFTVYLNDRPRMKGRAEVNEVPCDTSSGVVLQLIVRTRMTDARYACTSAPITLEGISVKDFVVAIYGQIGFSASDFKFGDFGDVGLMTGKSVAGVSESFEEVKIEQAKIQPTETIYAAVERHLKRFHATHWDDPEGKILVGRPKVAGRPLYKLKAKRGPQGKANNVLSCTRIKDWSEVPSSVTVYGHTRGKEITSSKFKATETDDDVELVLFANGHFDRPVIIQDQQSTSLSMAQTAAKREMSARIRRKDAWEVTTDGWSFWTGSEQIPWANNTLVDVDIDAVGGAHGAYLIVRVSLRLDLMGAATTSLTLVAPGSWII